MGRKFDVTKCIDSTTVFFKEFNISTGSIIDSQIDIKDLDKTMSNEKIIALLRNKYGHENAVMVVDRKPVKAYYGMTKETFTRYARPTNNKDGRNLIKRTLNAYNIEYMGYDIAKNETYHSNTFIDKIDETEIFSLKTLNLIRKNLENLDVRIIKVNDFDRVSEMYGMDVSTFIKYATVIESSEMNDDDNENE